MHLSFEAHAVHPDFGNEVVEGRIYFDDRALHFHSETSTLEIPFTRLEPSLGQGEDERIYFRDRAQRGLQIVTRDQSLLEHHELTAARRVADLLSERMSRRELIRRVKILAGFCALFVLLAWLGTMFTGWMVQSIAARIPAEWERKWGDTVLEGLRQEMNFIDDTNRVSRLAELAAPLVQALPPARGEYRFYLVEDRDPNAFALPGGHIIVTTGMLTLVERPEELLGTIAHEVAHVTKKHSFRSQISAGGPILIFQLFFSGGSGFGTLAAAGSTVLVAHTFSQEYEIEADDIGWDYLVSARVDPRGMTEMLRKLDAYEAQQDSTFKTPEAFSTHPATAKRIARLDRKWSRLSPKPEFRQLNQNETFEMLRRTTSTPPGTRRPAINN